MSTVAVAKDIFRERGIGPDQLPPAQDKLLPLNKEAEKQRATQVGNNFGWTSPGLVQNATDLLFRDLWLRPALAPRDRSGNGERPDRQWANGADHVSPRSRDGQRTDAGTGANDVLLDILYCGVCHSDIHTARGEWGPAHFPCVPGHEIIGRVRATGPQVTKFKVGDIGGVGCMVNSCRTCEHCEEDLEQYCEKGATFTYDTPDASARAGHTQGGYSDKIVVTEHFVIRIPPGVNLAATAPLLCAGITTFSPMRYWKLREGQRVGIIGVGGLGHVAVKLAAAHKGRVTVFTTSPSKVADAMRLGALEAIVSSDANAMKPLANQFDLSSPPCQRLTTWGRSSSC